jgi:3-oxoadipate enol-lactonase
MFEPVVDRFATRHRVIVPDLRGFGRSRALLPPYSAKQLAADLSHLLTYLGVESSVVLGYSQGGAIAQQLVLDFPARCNRLVLGCTYAFNMATAREKLEGHLLPWLVRILGTRRLAELVVSQGARELNGDQAAWLIRLMADQDRTLMVAASKEAMAFDSRRRLAEIACPTLVIAGAIDRAVPMHHARLLHAGIAGSQLVVIAGAGHSLIWTHRDAFVEVVEKFLGAKDSGDSNNEASEGDL